MRNIPREKIQEVLDRVDIERVIGRTVALKRQGNRLVGLCPFHKEKSPSFSVDPQKKLFHCFGCQVGGDVFGFVQRMEAVDFGEAVRMLAKEVGVVLPEHGESEEERRHRVERERLFVVNEIAEAFFLDRLHHDGRAMSYLIDERGLSKETVAAFRLGFAPDSWSATSEALQKKGVTEAELLKLGLVGRRKEGHGVYDKLRGRVIFPIRIPGGHIAGFGARRSDWLTVEGEDRGPKYLNSPESPVYDKSSIFYGLDRARDPIRRAKRAILVEGYLDVIGVHQAGVELAIATCGTAISGRHAAQLQRLTEEVVTLYDGDAAGEQATRRASELLLATGLSVRVATLPAGEDPDTYARKFGAAALNKLLDEAPSAIDYAVDAAAARHKGGGVAGNVKIVDEIRPLIAAVKDPLQRDLYADGAARRIGIDPRILLTHLRRPGEPLALSKPAPPPPKEPPPRQKPPGRAVMPSPVEQSLFRHLVENPGATVRAMEAKEALSAFHHPAVKAGMVAGWAAVRGGAPFDAARALEAAKDGGDADDEVLRVLRETLLRALPNEDPLEECLEKLLKEDMQRRLGELKARVQRETDPEERERLGVEMHEIVRRMAAKK
ncbi:MAG: DNA primase [Myxococcota bacterium]